MNRTLAFLLASAIAVSCAIGIGLVRSNRARQAEVAAARAQAEEAARQLAEAQASQKQTEAQRDQLMKLADQVGTKLRQATSNSAAPVAAGGQAAPAEPAKGGLGNLVSAMMSDPDTRQMIRDQQRMSIEQLYTPLIRKLGLKPEAAARFKDLLAENMIASTEKAMALMGDKGSGDKSAAVASMAEDQKRFAEEVRSVLGEEGYTQYKDYQETLGERAQLNAFRQTNSGDNPITDAQSDKLLALMLEEKRSVQAETGTSLPNADQGATAAQAMLKEEQATKMLEAQELVGQRVYQRAGEILSPEQLQSFARFQTNQLQMMRLGVTMARKMFGQ